MSTSPRAMFVLGGLAALVGGGLLSLTFLPSAVADEQPMKTFLSSSTELFPSPFDPSGLVKFNIINDGSVSTDVVHTATVKKIGAGNVTQVTIVTTPTGTYSSDAIFSPYIQYPGLTIVPKTPIEIAADIAKQYGISVFVPVYSGSFVMLAPGA